MNDGVYIDVDNIFNSSNIMYNKTNHFIYQYVNTTPTASYFIPYYYLMDKLIESINIYNNDNDIINISTKIQSDGSVKTLGMIGDYLLSEYFMLDDQDPLGLYSLYNIGISEQKNFSNSYLDDDIYNSLWYIKDYYSEEDISSRIDQLYSYMRSSVAKSRTMIGRVTDETYLKTLMLDISIKYNDLFRVPAGRGIEVFGIDSRDIIRLSTTNKAEVIVNSSYSFGRAIYESSGGFGVILTAILILVLFITSVVKPLLVIIISVLLIYNMLIKNMVRLDRGKTLEGLIYTLCILSIVNAIYSLFIKLSMSLPSLSLTPLLSIIGQIIIQCVYLFIVKSILEIIFKDMYNMGFTVYNAILSKVVNYATGKFNSLSNQVSYTQDENKYIETAKTNNDYIDNKSDNLLEELNKRDIKREEETEDSVFFDKMYNKNKNNNTDK